MKHKIVKSAVICLLVSSMLPIRPCEVHASATNTAYISASVNAASEDLYYVDFSDEASVEHFNAIGSEEELSTQTQNTGILTDRTTD